MLESTFIHLPNFGPKKEKKLWDSGIKTWNDYLEHFASSRFHRQYCTTLAQSKCALNSNDPNYFANVLPNNETWRAYPHFSKTAYLDIETTGLSGDRDHITVVGIFDGSKTMSYIYGQNLDDLNKDICNYDLVVTFNGSLFDLPFLRKNINGIAIPSLHIDLRFLLSSMSITGGLKKIEQKFGFEREDDLKGLNGYDAVKLWRKYRKNNDASALDKLVRYNAADIENLKKLLDWAYKEKKKEAGFC
ncbi:ribonuclease H-like domain-containing protein [Candidatus Micrarchaeota archaeon]|nr:ribonuclease H-like domain-containing protein [Candidatus Micrarchaeota archaeon]MBU1886811.1 ribonuclease H-like domain-containing protein [Candidatus Micrarchaeota archaeon]